MAAIMADWSLVLMCFFRNSGVISSLKVGCQPSKLDVNLQSWMFTFEVGCQPARAESVDGLPQPSES